MTTENPTEAPTPPPHQTQAPTVAPVPYDELQKHIAAERSVHNGAKSLVQGIRQRLEQIVGDDSGFDKDPAAARAELRQLVSDLNADVWARALVENTTAKNDPDPQSNPPVQPKINV